MMTCHTSDGLVGITALYNVDTCKH